MQLLIRVDSIHLAQEREELLPAVLGLARASDFAGGDVQRGEQGAGAMANIVMGSLFSIAHPHRQQRGSTVQGLDLRLFVNTENYCILGRVQIQADHVGDFADQFRVCREFERFTAPWLDSVLSPGLGYGGVADAQMSAEQA